MVFTQQSFFGTVRNVQTCPDCHGTGKVIKDKVSGLPRHGLYRQQEEDSRFYSCGIDNDSASASRQRRTGNKRRPAGDLLVEVVVGRHPIFQRQDENIYCYRPMSFAIAALGGESY